MGFMHEFGTISIANLTYTRSQNYAKMVVGKNRTQTFKVVVVVLLVLSLYLLIEDFGKSQSKLTS